VRIDEHESCTSYEETAVICDGAETEKNEKRTR